jgi:hypothetical protein
VRSEKKRLRHGHFAPALLTPHSSLLTPHLLMLRLLQKLDYARMVLGICLVIDGFPLIFFFKETLRLAPNSAAFTAVVWAFGFLLMVPFTVFRKLYKPNILGFYMMVAAILLMMFYMVYYVGEPGYAGLLNDSLYFVFALIFLFILVNVPNDIIDVAMPVIVLFTLVSNLALIYAMVTDPTWVLGQRAAINFGSTETGERMGNPHVFARNALMGVVACAVWAFDKRTSLVMRIFALFTGAVSAAILVMTQTRSSILAFAAIIGLFLFYNVRPAQVKMAVRGLMRPWPLLTIAIFIGGVMVFLRRNWQIYALLYGYVYGFIERNVENIYALLGMQTAGGFKAQYDASSVTRTVSTGFLGNVLEGHMEMLILGKGFKSLYLDIPILEAWIDFGMLGLLLFGGLFVLFTYYSLRAMRHNPNPLTTFLAYTFILFLVQAFTNGRPNEPWHWYPLALMIRFVGNEYSFPIRLWTNPPAYDYDGYAVPNEKA